MRVISTLARVLVAAGLVMLTTLVVGCEMRGSGFPPTATDSPSQDASTSGAFVGGVSEFALAEALVNALNRGDIDTVVELFDPDATIQADRYAWKTDENTCLVTHADCRIGAH